MENQKELFARRLNEICDEMGIPPKGENRQTEVGKLFGVSQKGARKWLEGEGFPGTDITIAIAKWGNVSYEWLMTGRGLKRPQLYSTDMKIQHALAVMERMPEYKKAQAIKILDTLAEPNTGTDGPRYG